MSLVSGEKSNFQFILRLLNTNVDGKQKVMYALTKIKGVGRRYSNLVCKKADVDLNKRYDTSPNFYAKGSFSNGSEIDGLVENRIWAGWHWHFFRWGQQKADILSPLTAPVSLRPKSSSVSSPSSRTLPNTRSRPGSSTGSATSSTARTARSLPTTSTRSCAKISSA
jgi:hypothetical protein